MDYRHINFPDRVSLAQTTEAEQELHRLQADLKRCQETLRTLTKIEARLSRRIRQLKWMVGATFFLEVIIFVRVMFF